MPICVKCGRMQPSAEISRGKCKNVAACTERALRSHGATAK